MPCCLYVEFESVWFLKFISKFKDMITIAMRVNDVDNDDDDDGDERNLAKSHSSH